LFRPSSAAGVDDTTLKIGSKAPKLDVEHWLSNGKGRFDKVSEFKSGKVYVVEFWATWCPPCVASMPHLSKLQEKHAGRGLQIVSISDEDLETVEKFLTKKVKGDSDKTYAEVTNTYCLTTDPDQSSYEDYMLASGQPGIPTAFIVGKKGEIEWIGHPEEIDEPLEQVLSDKWDRAAYLKEMENEKLVMKELESVFTKMQEGDSAGALQDVDDLISKFPGGRIAMMLKAFRLEILLQTGSPLAAAALTDLAATIQEPEMKNQLAMMIVELKSAGQEIDSSLIQTAAKIAEDAVTARPTDAATLDTLARLYHLSGDLDKAIATQRKAVENATRDIRDQIEPFLKQLLEEQENR
jgi:thiol-disulfide isomerase/thioredoxin